jgi:kynureninase
LLRKEAGMTRNDLLALDAADPLAGARASFVLPDGVIYLDGNSLGAMPLAAAARLAEVAQREWAQGLIRSWNDAGWIDAPRRVGAKIAQLIGAHADEVICADSTSINLFKVLACALRLQGERPRFAATDRVVILTERGNFPTDLYIAQGLADLLGNRWQLRQVDAGEIAYHIDETTAVLMLTQVNYRSGAMHDMEGLTRQAQYAGALTIWDLAHSAGALPVNLSACNADFALGCGYKYLNGGPGAPAFVYAARRHLAALAQDRFAQPLSGWMGHRAPFDFAAAYQPATSIDRFAVGTPSILALAALDCGVDTVLSAGIGALREKSLKMSELLITLIDKRCADLGLTLVTPREPARRGSQVSLAHENAWPLSQALIDRGVIGDFRRGRGDEPGGEADILRLGLAPLYLRYVDLWDAVEQLRDLLATRAWDRAEYSARRAVT